ncbi:MAG: radical SAM protein [Oscillospiraceae bacterium]|jgi:uncharacterized protein|nr:radical SAM protein [Oscillospiraceae bacterium]
MLKESKFNVCITSSNEFCIANTLTGAVVKIDKRIFDSIKKNDFAEISVSEFNTLQNEGFLIDADLDEIALLRHSYTNCKADKTISHITICTTLECNFACPYCYETRKLGSMDIDVQDNVISFIESILNDGVKKIAVTWYGGEPLLYPTIVLSLSLRIRNICEIFQAEYSCTMITNGYLINENVIELFEEIGLSAVQITIDGDKNIHNSRRKLTNGEGTFDTIINNVKLIPNSISVIIRVNIDRSNQEAFYFVNHLFENQQNIYTYPASVTIEKTQSEHQRCICFSHEDYHEFYGKSGHFDMLSNIAEKMIGVGVFSCSAESKYGFVIDPRGYVYKCINDISNPKFAINRLSGAPISKITAVSKYLGRDPFTEVECSNCAYLPVCYGGCVWAYLDKGTHSCRPEKFLFEKIIRNKYLKGGETYGNIATGDIKT